MKLNFKNVLFLIAVVAMAFGFFGISNVNAANTLNSSTYRDVDLNGTVERIVLVFDENVTACTYDAADWAVTVAGSIGVTAITGISCTGSDANLTVNVTTTAGVTGGSTDPTITYANVGTAGSVTLTSGVMTAKTASPTDLAKPQIKTFAYEDSNANGFIDAIEVAYTEAVQSGSVLGANDLIFTSVGGFTNAAFGALATDLITVNGVTSTTVPLGTPTTVSGTVNPSGTIAISTQNLFSLLDTAGNNNTTLGAQTNATILDGANPLLLSAARTTVNTIALTFSEMMDVDSLTGAGWSVAGATVTANTDPADGSTLMILTTTGQTSTAGTADVTYAFISGSTKDASDNILLDVSVPVEAVDQVRPTVAITLSDYVLNVGETALVTFTFSEEPTDFAAADVTVVNGILGAIDDSVVTAQTAIFTPTVEFLDLTNIITVGTNWTDSSPATNAPIGTTDSLNFIIDTRTSSTGGGGGGSRAKRATPAVPAKVALPADCLTGVKFSPSTGQNCNAATPATPNAQGNAFGTLTVKMGTKGEACRAWQSFFNAKGAKLVVDGWCGNLTIGAAKSWQASKGLKADGLLGPMSRAKALAE